MGNLSPDEDPEIPKEKGSISKDTASEVAFDAKMAGRLGEVIDSVAGDEPLERVVDQVMAAIAELFQITQMIFMVVADDLIPTLKWSSFGYPKDRAQAFVNHIAAQYYPKVMADRIFSDEFRITKHGYFLGAEEWLKLVANEPFSDTPAYYRNPEKSRLAREAPDEWHEADSYLFDMRDKRGRLLAWIELDYSSDGKLLSKETVQKMEPFADMLTIALLRERIRAGHETTRTRATQRTDLMEDVLKISSSIVSERDVTKLSDMILSSVSSLFGFRKVSLVVYDETDGVFKWKGLFGYPDEAVRDTQYRTIPTDVIFDDLKESRRVGKSVYFTPAEELSPRQLAHYVRRPDSARDFDMSPRKKGEVRAFDCLAFSLHDATGRIVGVIYPSDPKNNLLPDADTVETMEIFTSLAEVALENARLSNEREVALRMTSQRTEQLSRILDMTSGMMYVRDLDMMLDSLLKTLALLLGFRRMTIGVKHEELGEYKVEALYGYSTKAAEDIKKLSYKMGDVDSIYYPGQMPPSGTAVKWRKKVGRMTYYMPAESQTILKDDLPYYPEPELMRMPRRGKGYWHELDYLDTFIFDRKGNAIAYLEILKPRDDRIPDPETIEIVEIFASLVGIAIENARVFEEHINSRRDAELYTDVLSHDIKNYNQAILGYMELLRMKLKEPENTALLDKVSEQVMNTIWLASNVRTMSKVAFAETDLSRIDLGAIVEECRRNVIQYYPGRKTIVNTEVEPGHYFTNADEMIRELFTNILTNAVKYDHHETVVIDIGIDWGYLDEKKHWVVSMADHGRGISDDEKGIIFDRFSKASKKKGSGLGLHIVKTLARRYGGKVWVEDRVAGDSTQGSVFKVQLPALE
jgi:signal transduction histidine kinase